MNHAGDASFDTTIQKSITVALPVADVYAAFDDAAFIPRFVEHLQAGHGEASDVAIETTAKEDGRLIRWRWREGDEVRGVGTFSFREIPSGRGTEVRAQLSYDSPGGKPGRWIQKLMGAEPRQQLSRDLFRLRQLLEAGEIASTVGQPAARGARAASRDRRGTAVGKERGMKAACWMGKHQVEVHTVDDPGIINPRDAIVRITSTAICGSDLHLYDGYIPTMKTGDVLGHESMGEVVEVGSAVKRVSRGDRVVVPFSIACGACAYCRRGLFSCCDNSNPNAHLLEGMYGASGAALFGYSHLMGGYAGGQAEYLRVPFADVGLLKVPDSLTDEQVLFLSDIFPTGYMAAENCGIRQGDVIAVWGCGPVGQFAIRSAFLLGAERVIAIDREPARLEMARAGGAEVLDFSDDEVALLDSLKELTGGRGPDHCIDAVGLEAYGTGADAIYDRAKTTLFLATDRPTALRQAIQACGKAGTVSIPGVYGGFLDKIPLGAAFSKGLTLKMGQTHVHRYMNELLKLVEDRAIDPSFVITHRFALADAPRAYELFKAKSEGCVKVVLTP